MEKDFVQFDTPALDGRGRERWRKGLLAFAAVVLVVIAVVGAFFVVRQVVGVFSSSAHTVTFYLNDGTDGVHGEPFSVTDGYTLEVPLSPKREGHIFLYWSADRVGGTPRDLDVPIESDIDLYAQWAMEYTSEMIVELAESVVQSDDAAWYVRLVNSNNPLDSDFVPELRAIGLYRVMVDARIFDALSQMIADCNAANGPNSLWVQSGFRSYESQQTLFENRVLRYTDRGLDRSIAEANAATRIAAPGTSEHQSGLAVDFNCVSMRFADTAASAWLIEHAHTYGFILRYPKESSHITGVSYEPWHFRYIGVTHATAIFERGITLEEYVQWYLER